MRRRVSESDQLSALSALFVEVIRRGGARWGVQFRDAVPRIVVHWPWGGVLLDVQVDDEVSEFVFGPEGGRHPVADVAGAAERVLLAAACRPADEGAES
jgi:hypothetical protein